MTRLRLVTPFVLAGLLLASGACSKESKQADRTPLPTVAASPYICGYLPLKAVELMTGVKNPLVRGGFDLTSAGGVGDGGCAVYQPDGERLKVLEVGLSPDGHVDDVEDQLDDGALPLPEIVPGGVGYYLERRQGERFAASALLVRGKAELGVDLLVGVEGRDNAGDVVALMKLIAPKLITDASDPGASPSRSGKG